MARTNARAHGSAARATAKAGPVYDSFKEFEGKKYTGMKIGRGHKWHYEPGEWREKKLTPDTWEFQYDVRKGRTGKAPEGSGVPVGTQYHWYILAHQTATKLDANNYTTEMTGLKFKLAHKRAGKPAWSASDRAQRKRLIQILKNVITDLETDAHERDANGRADSSPPKPVKLVANAGVSASRASKRVAANGKPARAVSNGSARNGLKSAGSSKPKQRPSKTAKIGRAPERRRAA
jgi:hypothetical protein